MNSSLSYQSSAQYATTTEFTEGIEEEAMVAGLLA